MADLETIFKSEFDHELFHGIRDRIFQTKCSHLEPFKPDLKSLSDGERIVIHVNSFIWEVANGGLSQFLSNPSGDYAEETLAAMRAIGATAAVAALEDVRKVIFGGAPIPADYDTRNDILFKWEEDEERATAFEDKHNLRWCESVVLAVALYILSNKEMFT